MEYSTQSFICYEACAIFEDFTSFFLFLFSYAAFLAVIDLFILRTVQNFFRSPLLSSGEMLCMFHFNKEIHVISIKKLYIWLIKFGTIINNLAFLGFRRILKVLCY